MYGEHIKISKNMIMVEGMVPGSILIEPDIANAVVYKYGQTVYLFDTGATVFMRQSILDAVESFRPFKRFVLLNSHGHPDHTANNGIINELEADVKKHYISGAGLQSMEFRKYFLEKYGEMDRYYNYLDGPGLPLSVATKFMKLISAVNSRFKYMAVEKSINKFKPFDTSPGTAEAFECSAAHTFSGALAGWTGWKIEGPVFAMETRGHSPDHLVFYIPDEKTLILSDEAFPFFNCWPDSNSRKVERALEMSIQMAERGDVETVITGHDHSVFRGIKIEQKLRQLLADYRYFREAVIDIVKNSAEELTVHRIYSKLGKEREHPSLGRFFSLEFPKMPPMLKTVIICMLLELGVEVSGPEGRAVFSMSGGKDEY